MSNSTLALARDESFDAFLEAHIGRERNGMMLSVVSALGRLGFDPWAEARRLSELPPRAAEAALELLIRENADTLCSPAHIDESARRLTALLPRKGASAPHSLDTCDIGKSQKIKAVHLLSNGRLAVMVGCVAFWVTILLMRPHPAPPAASPNPQPIADTARIHSEKR